MCRLNCVGIAQCIAGFLRALPPLAVLMLAVAAPVRGDVIGFVEYEGQRNDNLSAGYFTYQVVQSPDDRFIYAVAFGPDNTVTSVINVYLRDRSLGSLTLVQTVADTAATDYGLRNAAGIAISPDGVYLYVSGMRADSTESVITWFGRDADSGTLRYVGEYPANRLPFDGVTFGDELRINNDGRHLYVASNDAGGSILTFSRADNGALEYVDTLSHGGDLNQLTQLTLSPDGKSIYALSASAKALVVLARTDDTGRLQHVQTIDNVGASTGDEPLADPGDVISSADAQWVYVTAKMENRTGDITDDQYAVLTFARLPDSRQLEYRDEIRNAIRFNDSDAWDTLKGARSLALSRDADQRYLYVGVQDADAINMFQRDTDGELTWVGWVTEGEGDVTTLDGVQNILVSDDGRHIYAALDMGDGISVFDTRTDLQVVLQAESSTVTADKPFEYDIIITNAGASDAQNVVATVRMPGGMAFRRPESESQTVCTTAADTVTCELGSVTAGTKVTHTLTMQAPQTLGVAKSTVSVTTEQVDTDSANDVDEESVCVEEAKENGAQGAGRSAGEDADSCGTNVTPPPTKGEPSESSSESGGGAAIGLVLLCAATLGRRTWNSV